MTLPVCSNTPSKTPAFLNWVRTRGKGRCLRLGFPNTKNEFWGFATCKHKTCRSAFPQGMYPLYNAPALSGRATVRTSPSPHLLLSYSSHRLSDIQNSVLMIYTLCVILSTHLLLSQTKKLTSCLVSFFFINYSSIVLCSDKPQSLHLRSSTPLPAGNQPAQLWLGVPSVQRGISSHAA